MQSRYTLDNATAIEYKDKDLQVCLKRTRG